MFMTYKNKEELYKKQKEHRQRNRQKVFEYLSTHSCVDCAETHPATLDFDHVRGEKSWCVGRAVSGSHRSWDRILEEIAKCEVRCANCHRKKTAIDFNWYIS